jgi:hypothetical protein
MSRGKQGKARKLRINREGELKIYSGFFWALNLAVKSRAEGFWQQVRDDVTKTGKKLTKNIPTYIHMYEYSCIGIYIHT